MELFKCLTCGDVVTDKLIKKGKCAGHKVGEYKPIEIGMLYDGKEDEEKMYLIDLRTGKTTIFKQEDGKKTS